MVILLLLPERYQMTHLNTELKWIITELRVSLNEMRFQLDCKLCGRKTRHFMNH